MKLSICFISAKSLPQNPRAQSDTTNTYNLHRNSTYIEFQVDIRKFIVLKVRRGSCVVVDHVLIATDNVAAFQMRLYWGEKMRIGIDKDNVDCNSFTVGLNYIQNKKQ